MARTLCLLGHAITQHLPAAGCQCPAHARGINNFAAMLAATGCKPIVLRDRFDGAEEVACYHDLGQHLARTYEGDDCRITRSWCEQWLMSVEGMLEPLSDEQWHRLADAIDDELSVMVAEERDWARATDTEEREIASLVRGSWADAAVAAE